MLSTTVSSFTKQRQYNVIISREYLNENDRVLFIDDFLAYGNAAKGIMELVEQSGAELVGMGFIIEKHSRTAADISERKEYMWNRSP